MSHILLIEPNTILAALYTQTLVHVGFSATHVTGAQAAIHAADEQKPDVVVLELQLPEHSGLEFLHEFRSYAEWQMVPVVVHTVMQPGRLNLQALRKDFGVRVVLYKPKTTLEDLLRSVRQQVAV